MQPSLLMECVTEGGRSLHKEAGPIRRWSLVMEDHRGQFFLHELTSGEVYLDPAVMTRARECFLDHHSSHWNSCLLMPFAKVELGTAIVAATQFRPGAALEVIPCRYQSCQTLAAAFHQPELFPRFYPPLVTEHEPPTLPLSNRHILEVGADIIIFRLRFERARTAFQLGMIALVAFGLGLGVGMATGNAELGVAVAAALIQFAQIVLMTGRGRKWATMVDECL